ncbi:DNA polymerase III subunit delta [Synechococcus sp. M16CYN]|uniref:DNA polymerase III subunit delta n=1 Tax=Synechococcus sp. M16CYN TaxID=3103139 RepID=UPI0032431DC4
MPIHLIWGDDVAARDRAIDSLISRLVDPNWNSLNLSRLDGAETDQAAQSLEEARTPPFAAGERLVLLQRSPFCNDCPSELTDRFEAALDLIPETSHLVLVNSAKPDGRLRTTKAVQKRIKQGLDLEQSFLLPAAWDGPGQRQLVQRTADALSLELEYDAVDILVDSIGTDSIRLESELHKLSLRATRISADLVKELVEGTASNILAVGDAILDEDPGEAIAGWDALIDTGESALRIIATLTGQVRGWLWVSLLEQHGEHDVGVIAKAAGISNPKRIYVMRKQLQGRPPKAFLSLLGRLLEVEARLKRGAIPGDAFRDGLLG